MRSAEEVGSGGSTRSGSNSSLEGDTLSAESFEDVLRDPLKAALFGEFLASQHANETLLFLQAADAALKADDRELRALLIEINGQYVAEEASQQVGMSSSSQQGLLAAAQGPPDARAMREALREACDEVTSMLEVDKFNAFCDSAFFVMLQRGLSSRSAVLHEAVISAFLRLCCTDEDWLPAASKDPETKVWQARLPGHSKVDIVQRERLFFPKVQADRLADFFYDDEVHQSKYYPVCLRGALLQRFGPDFKVTQMEFVSKVVVKMSFVVVQAVFRASLPDGSHMVLRKSVPWPQDLMRWQASKKSVVTTLPLGGYLIQPSLDGVIVTRFMQIHMSKDLNFAHKSNIARRVTRLLSQARDHYAMLQKEQAAFDGQSERRRTPSRPLSVSAPMLSSAAISRTGTGDQL